MWPEGLPTSILEAGLMKCAVIATPFGGTKEIIENNNNGLLITNQEELTLALKKLIANKDLQNTLSNNLYNKIKNEFLWENTANKVLNDINNYVKKKDSNND